MMANEEHSAILQEGVEYWNQWRRDNPDIEDWHTNIATNLTDVICDYIYLRQGQKERRPSIGDFAPGEFAKLFQKS
ncbi:MAG: hypothetical protein ACYTX0_44975, partial [Nostoc sp.]